MRKWCTMLLALALLTPSAYAETELTGTVEAGRTFAVYAAYGGTVDAVYAQAGDLLSADDVLLTLSGEKIYAPLDGVATAVFAGEGDDASAATARYGSAIVIEPRQKFTVYMTAEEDYNISDTRRMSVGETIYLRCSEDGTHRGVGIVTAVEGLTYTVEIIGGQFSNGEVVYAGRVEGFVKSQRVGVGTVIASEIRQISADGTVINCCVSAGEAVESGQLLMEVAPGTPCGSCWNGGEVTPGEAGIVTAISVQQGGSVEQGQVVAVLADPEDLIVEVNVSEDDLPLIAEGDAVTVWLKDEIATAGIVEQISHMLNEDGAYTAVVRFEGTPENAVLGQSATVVLTDVER